MARLTLLAALASGCAGPRIASAPADRTPSLGRAWFESRAADLGLTVAEAEARDALLPEDAPPEDIFDKALATEAALIWRDHCAACHGHDGEPPEALGTNPPPRAWGTFGARMGFFFGGDKMRAGIYRTIANGRQDDRGTWVMPPWGGQLSREQLWGLVRHIEGL